MQAEMIQHAFRDIFGRRPAVLTQAPGRLEILGNHTDYNEGVVLSVAVDRTTRVAMAPCAGGRCRVIDAVRGEERTFDAAAPGHPEAGDWGNYIKGLVVEFDKRGIRIPAFHALFGSTVPLSAGMSSSAALEMSMALAMAHLAGAELPWREIARIGQACENLYVGANTGLLDQFSSLRGQAGHLVFSDFRTLDVRNVPIPAGTALVVANSMVKHTLTNEYNERREACEQAVAILAGGDAGIRALRDVSPACLEDAKKQLPPIVYRRALHVVGENQRVFQGVEALAANDLGAFGQLMFASHESSRIHFENSCEELDALVAIAQQAPGAIGARLSGGGFGGITVHLVEQEKAEEYARLLADRYQQQTGLRAEVMICRAADGAGVIED
jgi:galactokinase